MSEDRAPLWRWQHVLSLLALLATAGGLYVVYFLRDRAQLDLIPLAESALADLRTSQAPDLELRFRGEPIQRASVLSFLISNTGNVHLQRLRDESPADPRNPRFRIILSGNSLRILSVQLRPKGDETSTAVERLAAGPNVLEYGIVVMNAGSAVQVDAIVSDYEQGSAATFEVAGVGLRGRVRRINANASLTWWQVIVAIAGGLIIVRVLRPITRRVAASAESRLGWVSLAGAAAYAFIWDFNAVNPSSSQRVQGLQWMLSSLVFVAGSAFSWRIALMVSVTFGAG